MPTFLARTLLSPVSIWAHCDAAVHPYTRMAMMPPRAYQILQNFTTFETSQNANFTKCKTRRQPLSKVPIWADGRAAVHAALRRHGADAPAHLPNFTKLTKFNTIYFKT